MSRRPKKNTTMCIEHFVLELSLRLVLLVLLLCSIHLCFTLLASLLLPPHELNLHCKGQDNNAMDTIKRSFALRSQV